MKTYRYTGPNTGALLADGREVDRLVRPTDPARLAQALKAIDP